MPSQYKRYSKVALALIVILSLYFLIRLPNLTTQPIFADEAIYIRWAQIMRAEPGLRFVSLQDGKTPLFMWLMIPFLKIFSDPLFAGRLLSILFGALTLLGIFSLTWRFFNLRAALIAASLVVFTPFFVFFDRLALVDSALAAFSIWTLFLALLLVRYPRFDLSMLTGYALGLGYLIKTPGIVNFVLLPLALFIFPWSRKLNWKRIALQVLLFSVAIFFGAIVISVLRLSAEFNQLANRDSDYLRPLSTIWQSPLDPFIPFLKDLTFNILPMYLTWPIFLLLLAGIFYRIFIRRTWISFCLILWTAIPLFGELHLLQTFTARYILFLIPPLIVLAGSLIDRLLHRLAFRGYLLPAVILFVLSLQPAMFIYSLHFDHHKLPLPQNELNGYFQDWTAGYGFPEIAEYLIDRSKQGKVLVATEGYFGTLPDGLLIYLDAYLKVPGNKGNLQIQGSPAQIQENLRDYAAKEGEAYFVVNKSRYPQPQPNIRLVKEFPKLPKSDGTTNAILLYQVLPLTQ